MVVLIVRSRLEYEEVGRHDLWLELRPGSLWVVRCVAGVRGSWWESHGDGLSRHCYTFREGAQTVPTFKELQQKKMFIACLSALVGMTRNQ